MTLTTTGDPNKGIVYLTIGVPNQATGLTDAEQLSGVLVSPDTVLTAAHGVFTSSGSLRTGGTAFVGYDGGSSPQVSRIDGVQVSTKLDYTTLGGIQGDYALVHLGTPVTDGTIFSLGSDVGSGTFTVAGYPVGTLGKEDTKTEPLSLVNGYSVYQGGTLHDGSGDPHGSSGGAVYQVVNGVPTLAGLVSGANASDKTQGFFKQLTSADVAQIRTWIANVDNPTTAPNQSVPWPAPDATPHSAPGFSPDVADMLLADAPAYGGAREAVMTDVANAISNACADGGSFSDMVADAAGQLSSGASYPARAVAYLAGLVSGTTGTGADGVATAANALVDGSVSNRMTRSLARAGYQEGSGMGFAESTSAPANRDALALAGVIADGGALGAVSHTFGTMSSEGTVIHAAGSFVHHAA